MKHLNESRLSSYSGFTISELAIALLLLSLIAVAGMNFLKSNSQTLKDNYLSQANSQSGDLIRNSLFKDLRNAVALNPSCDDNASLNFISGDCDELKIRAGITPLPATTKEDLDGFLDFLPNDEATAAVESLNKSTDSFRILTYAFEGDFNCRLNPRHTASSNPSQAMGTALGDERMWAHPQCAGLLDIGKIYILTEEIDGIVYSNIFQITDLSTETLADSTTEIQIDHRSDLSHWNQRYGLGLAGYTSAARIFPVTLIEWTVGESGGLYRREISPNEDDLLGKLEWKLKFPEVEGMQLVYLTGEAPNFSSHNRSFDWSGTSTDNGFEDVRGLTPRIVIKSPEASQNQFASYDNPLTEDIENDSHPREEVYFFAALVNR